MTTVQQYYDYSLLSLTAYAITLSGDSGDESKYIDAGLTAHQAAQFIAEGWETIGDVTQLKVYYPLTLFSEKP